jgi:hypothetical protein
MFTSTRIERVKRLVGVLLASVLLAGLLASIFPLETLATGRTCSLACCAGRTPHAAGSCMDGACHAALKKHSSQIHSSHPKEITEQLCGLARFARILKSRERSETIEVSSQQNESGTTQLSSTTITKPCAPDCGSCGAGFASADFRNHAVITRREQSRPLVGPGSGRASFAQLLTQKTLIRQSAPRAPPTTLF